MKLHSYGEHKRGILDEGRGPVDCPIKFLLICSCGEIRHEGGKVEENR